MLQLSKRFLWVALLVSGLQVSWGFALLGPVANGGDAWQSPTIGYNPNGFIDTLPSGPKNLGEEYRRNTPVIFYTYDANFLDYFGSNGVVAVDGAFAVWNSLTNVDSYSRALTEFPLNTQHFNFTAQALGMSDLKSTTMYILAEQLGLAQPDRYTWTLHAYDPTPFSGAKCPIDSIFLVVQRNYDIVASPLNQLQYSPYVNGTLYSYDIFNYCTAGNAPLPPELAVAVPFPVDPFAQVYTAIASRGLNPGGFYTGVTRDDMAGLRYLLQTNNVNFETVSAGSLLENPGQTNVIQNFNLAAFLATALTNNPATVAALFPNLVIAGSSNYFTIVCTPNITSYLQPPPNGSPAGTPPTFIVVTNGTTCVPQTNYVYDLANVVTVTNVFTNSTAAFLQTITLSAPYGSPVGSPPFTNVTLTQIVATNVPPGDFFILPPGLCGININTNPYILNGPVTATTNVLTTATNANGFVFSQSIVTFFTNHYYFYQPVTCTPATTGLYQGIENIKFVRADFDSLIGQFFQPVTNNYTMVLVTNSQPVLQHFQRVVTAPEILFSARDLAGGSGNPIAFNAFNRNVNFNQANVLPGLAGPGTIVPNTTITYNKVGDVFLNGSLALNFLTTNSFLSELTEGQSILTWASFDATTNAPIVYPDGTSIQNLENQMLVQVTPPPPNLPGGTNSLPYATTKFTATGGAFSPPYTWGLAPGSALPAGLTLTTTNSIGTISGTPTQSGTFDLTIQLTDSLFRSVQWPYEITIQ